MQDKNPDFIAFKELSHIEIDLVSSCKSITRFPKGTKYIDESRVGHKFPEDKTPGLLGWLLRDLRTASIDRWCYDGEVGNIEDMIKLLNHVVFCTNESGNVQWFWKARLTLVFVSGDQKHLYFKTNESLYDFLNEIPDNDKFTIIDKHQSIVK